MQNRVVSHEEWLKARLQLLAAEKEFTRQRDALTRRRMAMPWERVEKSYRFEGPHGALSLADLFGGRSQLIVYHFMFAPDWEEGCKSCSFWADNFNGIPIHLKHRDVTLTAVSRAPLAKIDAYKKRMGWSFPWVSSAPTDFNFDLGFSWTAEQGRQAVAAMADSLPPIVEHNARASGTDAAGYLTESPGFSTFVREEDTVYHAYSTGRRGLEFLMTYYGILDRAPQGRDEGEAWQLWIRRHDEYESG